MNANEDFWKHSKIFGMFLLFSTLYQFVLNSSGQQDFVPVVAVSTVDVVADVLYLGGRQTLLCPTVVDDFHFLFEPNDNIGNGTFAYRMLNGSFSLTHNKFMCRNNQAATCDQLVMVYVPGSPTRGEFQIRYSAPSLSQLLVTVVFGPPFIEYFGQLPITLNSTNDMVRLIYRSLTTVISPTFAVCDALRNGNTSRILEVPTLSPNKSCLPPSPLSSNELNELLLFAKNDRMATEVVQVVMGSCPGDPNGLRSPLYRVIYEVPVPSTTPATVNDSESTTPPSQEDEVPLNTTIIIIIVIAGTLVIGIIVVVVVLAVTVCLRRRRRDQLDLTPGLNLPSGGQELAVCNGELPNGHQKVVETENLAPAETMDGDDKETEEELDITVSRLAFVTPDSSNRFQELENILLECHNCERAHPVARGEGSADQLLSTSDLHLTVSNWLKEDCLVYVIWAGSLEILEDDSPVKHLVRLFSLRRMLDKRDKASVMHRLVFLQLGSVGIKETRVSPNNSFWVFKKLSPVDKNFDSKQCGQEVFEAVQNRLQKLAPRQKDAGEEGAAVPGAPKYLKFHRRSLKLEDVKVLLEHQRHDIVHAIRDQGQRIKKHIDVRADDVNDSVATRELAETQELGETEAEEVGTEPTNNLNIIDDKKETKV